MKGMKGYGNPFGIVRSSVCMAFGQLGKDRFRTILSLSGVSIGIFCVTAAQTVTDSISRTMKNGISEFGGDALFIEQMPMEPDLNEEGVFRWWNYVRRPEVSWREYDHLSRNCGEDAQISYSALYNEGRIIAVDGQWQSLIRNDVTSGRGFSEAELRRGEPVVMLGSAAAEDSEGTVSIGGVQARIIGTFAPGGINSVGIGDVDNAAVIPYTLAERIPGIECSRRVITVQPDPGCDADAVSSSVFRQMRRIRRLDSGEDDNFSINRLSFVMEQMNGIFRMIGTLGWIIGAFSLLIGGFGIANIMFVNINERTPEIGLQKALGAGTRTLLLQYLTESAVISLAGGLAGTAMTAAVCALIPENVIPLSVSAGTFAAGVVTALVTGIIAGIAPAASAAKLHPAEALAGK